MQENILVLDDIVRCRPPAIQKEAQLLQVVGCTESMPGHFVYCITLNAYCKNMNRDDLVNTDLSRYEVIEDDRKPSNQSFSNGTWSSLFNQNNNKKAKV
jgi:hypothetical protein